MTSTTLEGETKGINFSAALETGVALVGEEVSIEVNIEAIQQNDEK